MEAATLNKIKTHFFVPPHTKGDKDFDGHGPNITCSVNIGIATDKKHLLAKINMQASESESDWTTCEGEEKVIIFSCDDGQEISKISSPISSKVFYTDNDHEEDFVISDIGETNTNAQNNNWELIKHNNTDLVRFYRFMGDVGGDEAGTQTGVEVFFNPISIIIKGSSLHEIILDVPDGIDTCGNNTCGSSATAALLKFYGIPTSCKEMRQRLESSANAINFLREVSGLNIGIDPNSVRDRLNEISNQFTLEEINNESVIDRIISLLRDHIPVLVLTGWGSKTVRNDYCRNDDSVSLNPNSVLHYMVVDGFNFQTNVFRLVDNGSRIFVNHQYLKKIILWHPENLFIEGGLYGCGVKPGKIIFGKRRKTDPAPVSPANSVSEIALEIRTGGDDLGGGNDNLNIIINFKSGSPKTMNNVNRGESWNNDESKTVRLFLDHAVKIEDIKSLVLTTTFSGGWHGDNWDMDALKITASTNTLFNKSGAPLFRFTGDKKTFTAEIQ
ncbi:MAG TPA: C39 family peptidase [Chitinophagaceae bacterium]|nr:C39 family peptidase [Chitinophagaceae bacterium]